MDVIPGILPVVFQDAAISNEFGKEIAGLIDLFPRGFAFGYSKLGLGAVDFDEDGIVNRSRGEEPGVAYREFSGRGLCGGNIDQGFAFNLCFELSFIQQTDQFANAASALLYEIANDILVLEDEVDGQPL